MKLYEHMVTTNSKPDCARYTLKLGTRLLDWGDEDALPRLKAEQKAALDNNIKVVLYDRDAA